MTSDPRSEEQEARDRIEIAYRNARSFAIEHYAHLEQAMCRLYGTLLGTSPQKAATVFFRITSAHARNAILVQLLKEEHGDTYRTFWRGKCGKPDRGIMGLIRQLDDKRNIIVHWHPSLTLAMTVRGIEGEISLRPPNHWRSQPDQSITYEELREFARQCFFVTRSVTMFDMITSGQEPPASYKPESWPDIFQQPVLYPPPEEHPLSPLLTKFDIQPQPSRL